MAHPPHPIRNEQVKLTAAWLNSIASSPMLVGTVAPVAAMLHGTATPKGGILFLFSGIGLHFQARRQMKEPRE
ncbi:hypothetical protein MVG78_17495 [Roseomonas gilardii subsp. gilardii]|uniref:hypothetical protein n=1 Tax=Roseomonas gilardii TaxID=257708 RepID=UPI001FF901CE|nr:hypothetical protein [Roseomonas gilardii]UPG72283.1 hypothetical protein MVG78_17495 [Roseomonas gilardii subsp. gilardii]